jgi:nicotinamide mononucleotide transporter
MLQALLALLRPAFATAFTAWGTEVTWIEVVAFALSLWMVVCEMKVRSLAWPLAIVTSLMYAALFADAKLYGEASLQLFFVAMSAWGWWQWRRGHGRDGGALVVHRLARGPAVAVGLATLASWPALGWLLARTTDSPVPFYDALPTVVSIAATFLLGRKLIENWPAWLAVNVFSVGLFVYKRLALTALLYALFAALSWGGWRAWMRLEGRVREHA